MVNTPEKPSWIDLGFEIPGRPAKLITKKALREKSFEQLLDLYAAHSLNRGKLTGLLSFASGDRELFEAVSRREWAHHCAATAIREELLQRFKGGAG